MNLFDASALLAVVHAEPGHQRVLTMLEGGGACSSANWSEVAQKVIGSGRRWSRARQVFLGFGLRIEPVTMSDAERAAELWQPRAGLSLADRLCLATGERLDAVIWTADTAWGTTGRIRQIR